MSDTRRMDPADVPDEDLRDVHTWFSLSYSNYAVLPRTLLQSMPDEWQDRFVRLMGELHEAFAHVPQADEYEVRAGAWQMVHDCTEEELQQAGVKGPEEEYELGEDGKSRLIEDEDPMWYRESDGATLSGHDYVFLPGSDPVPHYNRGRTYIEPRITARGETS